jgi:hypothetical protein
MERVLVGFWFVDFGGGREYGMLVRDWWVIEPYE